VRDKYLELIELLKDEEKVFVANGDQTPDGIAGDIWSNISTMLL